MINKAGETFSMKKKQGQEAMKTQVKRTNSDDDATAGLLAQG
jgi:hypothetical protein